MERLRLRNLWLVQVFLACSTRSAVSTVPTSGGEGQARDVLDLPSFLSQVHSSIDFWLPHGDDSTTWNKCTALLVDGWQTSQNADLDLDQQVQVQGNGQMVYLTQSTDKPFNFRSSQKTTAFAGAPPVHHHHFAEPCTIGYYFLPDITLLQNLALGYIRNLPGAIFNSFHVIFIPVNQETSSPSPSYTMFQQKLFESRLVQQYVGTNANDDVGLRNLKLMHHLLIVEYEKSDKSRYRESDRPSISNTFTFNLWFNETVALHLYDSNTFSIGAIGNRFPLLFPDKWSDLGGGTLSVATTPDSGQKQLEEFIRTGVVKGGGYSSAGTSYLLRHFNTTPFFVKNSAISAGQDPATGKWIGTVGQVLDGNAMFGTGLGIVYERAKVITYGIPYHFDKIVFITPLPKEMNEYSGSVDFLSRPFHPIVWSGIAISLLGTWLIVFLKKVYVPEEERVETGSTDKSSRSRRAKTRMELATAIVMMFIRPIFDQPSNECRSKRYLVTDFISRSLLSNWLLSLIVLTVGYKSSFISILLAPTVIYPPKTFEELANSNYHVGAVLYNETYMAPSFKALNNKIGLEIRNRVKGYSIYTPDCFLQVGKPETRDVCMGISAYIQLQADNFLTDQNGQPLYKMSKDSLFPISAGLIFPKEFPHLAKKIDVATSHIFVSGTMTYIFELERRYKAKEGRRLSQNGFRPAKGQNGGGGDVAYHQRLNHLISILVFGFSQAVTAFLVEIGLFHVKKFVQKRKSEH